MPAPWILLGALLVAQATAAEDKDRLLADDLRFAENLARHRYFDLAFEVIDGAKTGIERRGNDELAGEASLIEARILERKSENSADLEERLAILSQGIDALLDWSRPGSPYAYHDRLVDALETLAQMLRERGMIQAWRFRNEDVEAARELAEEDFRAAEKTYDELQREAEARAEQFESMEQPDAAGAMRGRAAETLYLRGVNSIEWADVASDPEFRLEQADDQLDEVQWQVSDETLLYYFAMYEQARALARLGDFLQEQGNAEDAAGYHEDARGIMLNILELAEPRFWEQIASFDASMRPLIATLFDRVWGALAQSDAQRGDLDAAREWIDRLQTAHADSRQPLGRAGHTVLLDWATKLNDLGQSSQATELVKRVADEGRGTAEGQRAEILLAELVRGGPIESTDVLLSVARGHYSERNFDDAAFYFERAASTLEGGTERAEFGFEAWIGAADSLKGAARSLEAAIAYEQALLLEQELGADPEHLERAAYGMYTAYDRRFRETQHAFDKQLRDQASDRLISMGIAKDLQFLKAQEAFAEVAEGDTQGYLRVLAEFEAVPEASTNYERSLVYIARCLAGADRLDEALAKFEEVEARATDPTRQPTNAEARMKREIAWAQARYHHASLLLDERVARPDEALAVLEDLEEEIPGQASFHQLAKYRRVAAHAMKGDVDEAEVALAVLTDSDADDSYIAGGAYFVARALEAASRAARDAGDADAAADLLTRAAAAMWIYNERSGFSSFGNMLSTGEWYLEVSQPDSAQTVFEKVIEVFDGRGDEDLDRARIGLATSLDKQSEFGRARPYWKDLLTRNPRSTTIRRGAARSFGGWLELDASGNVVEIPGSGDFQEAFDLWAELQKGAGVNNKYYGIWWEAKLGTIYTLYRLRAAEPEKGRQARSLIDNLKLSQPDYDEGTIELIPPEHHYEPLYKPFFRYLDRNVPAN